MATVCAGTSMQYCRDHMVAMPGSDKAGGMIEDRE